MIIQFTAVPADRQFDKVRAAGSGVVWGDLGPRGTSVVWGDSVFVNGTAIVWGDSVVWGDATPQGFGVVWGDGIVWGDSTQTSGEGTTVAIQGEN